MNARTLGSALLTALLGAACSGGDDPVGVPAPRVVGFSANPTSVEAGGTVTLTYQVVGATTLRIDTESGESVLPETFEPEAMGSVVTNPIDATTTFVLKAENVTGESMSSVTVTVGTTGDGPTIASFTATPASIPAGGSSTLSWQTANGTSARIEAGGATVYEVPEAAVAAGTYDVSPATTTAYRLVVTGAEGETAQDLTVTVQTATGPGIPSFTATPNPIDAGDTSTLSWEVVNATVVAITDAGGQTVYSGGDLASTVQVTPANTTQYTLVATDSAGASAMRQLTVTVNQPGAARVVSFAANPSMIDEGNQSSLEWEVADAPGGVQISAGGTVLHSEMGLTGSYAVSPAQTTEYTLTAMNPAGDAMARTTVTVNQIQPAIDAFTASANPVAVGGMTTLTWTTRNATQVRLLQAGVEVATSAMASDTYVATVTAEVTDFVLEATAPGGTPATRTLTVDGHNPPLISTFTVTPAFVSGPTTATVTWDVQNVSGLTLTLDGAPVAGFPTVMTTTAAIDVNGTLAVPVTGPGTFELTATSLAGSAARTVTLTAVQNVPEVEPNDTVTTPQVVGPSVLIDGAIGVADDLDIYRITVPDGGNVTAETSDGMGGCATDTVLIFADLQGNTITFDEDSGATGGCSRLDPAADPLLGDLPAGDYLIGVLHQLPTGIGAYTLSVDVRGPACGNAIIEATTMEQCDFGDTNNGDGCSATCQLEVNPTVISAPGGTVQVSLPNANAIAVVQVNVPMPGMSITATAADVGGATCNNVNTALNLGDSNFLALGGKADGGPTGTAGECASIVFPTDAFAADLAAGTYYLVVFNTGGAAAGPVEVTVGLQAPVCGNGVLEANAGEQCDNTGGPNQVPCDAMCQIVTGGQATLPSAAPVTVAGAVPASGFSLYEINVTAEIYLQAETFAPNQAGGCNADTVMELYDENFAFLGTDDDGGTSTCSRFDENVVFTRLTPGRYYVLVSEFNGGAIGQFALVLDSVAVTAASPTVEIEPNDTQAEAQDTGLTAAGTANLHAAIDPSGDDDVYFVTVPANTTLTLSARTYDTLGMPTSCTANSDLVDTRIFVEQLGTEATGQGTGELAFSDDISSTQWCSAITGLALQGGAAPTPYFIRVQGFGDSGVRQYLLNVTLQ